MPFGSVLSRHSVVVSHSCAQYPTSPGIAPLAVYRQPPCEPAGASERRSRGEGAGVGRAQHARLRAEARGHGRPARADSEAEPRAAVSAAVGRRRARRAEGTAGLRSRHAEAAVLVAVAAAGAVHVRAAERDAEVQRAAGAVLQLRAGDVVAAAALRRAVHRAERAGREAERRRVRVGVHVHADGVERPHTSPASASPHAFVQKPFAGPPDPKESDPGAAHVSPPVQSECRRAALAHVADWKRAAVGVRSPGARRFRRCQVVPPRAVLPPPPVVPAVPAADPPCPALPAPPPVPPDPFPPPHPANAPTVSTRRATREICDDIVVPSFASEVDMRRPACIAPPQRCSPPRRRSTRRRSRSAESST